MAVAACIVTGPWSPRLRMVAVGSIGTTEKREKHTYAYAQWSVGQWEGGGFQELCRLGASSSSVVSGWLLHGFNVAYFFVGSLVCLKLGCQIGKLLPVVGRYII